MKCPKCGEQKLSCFYTDKTRSTGYRWLCKKCHNQRRQQLYKEERKTVIEIYGGKCKCCGDDTYEFLVIDHINGGGNKQRKLLGKNGSGYKFCRWLRQHNYPGGYRVLCANCNTAIGAYGYCPHQIPAVLKGL